MSYFLGEKSILDNGMIFLFIRHTSSLGFPTLKKSNADSENCLHLGVILPIFGTRSSVARHFEEFKSLIPLLRLLSHLLILPQRSKADFEMCVARFLETLLELGAEGLQFTKSITVSMHHDELGAPTRSCDYDDDDTGTYISELFFPFSGPDPESPDILGCLNHSFLF